MAPSITQVFGTALDLLTCAHRESSSPAVRTRLQDKGEAVQYVHMDSSAFPYLKRPLCPEQHTPRLSLGPAMGLAELPGVLSVFYPWQLLGKSPRPLEVPLDWYFISPGQVTSPALGFLSLKKKTMPLEGLKEHLPPSRQKHKL